MIDEKEKLKLEIEKLKLENENLKLSKNNKTDEDNQESYWFFSFNPFALIILLIAIPFLIYVGLQIK